MKVMSVLFPVAIDTEQSATGKFRRRDSKDVKDQNDPQLMRIEEEGEEEDDESERFRIGKKTFETLLPSLYRNGQPSWNPTVNKMTALGLKRFMVNLNYLRYEFSSFRN